MSQTCNRIRLAIQGLVLFAIFSHTSAQAETAKVNLNLNIKDKTQRIISLEINIAPGWLVGLKGVPAGWRISIDNDPAGRVTITGGGAVGAAMIDSSELRKLEFYIEFGNENIAPTCHGTIQSTADFATVGTLDFSAA